jgi:hypothetical protein
MVTIAEEAQRTCSADETPRATESAAAVLAYAHALQAAVAVGSAPKLRGSLTRILSDLRSHLLHLGKDAVLGLQVDIFAVALSGWAPTRCAAADTY